MLNKTDLDQKITPLKYLTVVILTAAVFLAVQYGIYVFNQMFHTPTQKPSLSWWKNPGVPLAISDALLATIMVASLEWRASYRRKSQRKKS